MSAERIKITHIHTATKFIDGSRLFEDECIDNLIIAFKSFREYKGRYSGKIIEFDISRSNIQKVIELASQADIVVVYNLDRLKSYIVSMLPSHVYIVWRFFGGEYYQRNPLRYLTYLTQQYVSIKPTLWSRWSLHKIVYRYIVKRITKPYSLPIEEVLHRINLFVGLSREEYEVIKTDMGLSSRFLLLPKPNRSVIESKPVMDQPKVIVGNSKSEYNNHLDILRMYLSSSKNSHSVRVLFTYGSDNAYTAEVRRLVSLIHNAETVDSHMNSNEFTKFYNESAALVLNTLRQMAVGNIFMAFTQKVMVYMNPSNILYDTLVSDGFIIRTIEDFERVVSRDDEIYDESIVSYNAMNMQRLANCYSAEDFRLQFFSIYRNSGYGSKY